MTPAEYRKGIMPLVLRAEPGPAGVPRKVCRPLTQTMSRTRSWRVRLRLQLNLVEYGVENPDVRLDVRPHAELEHDCEIGHQAGK